MVSENPLGSKVRVGHGRDRNAEEPTLNSLSMGSLLCRRWDKSRRRW
jgi:hypothetical protein